MYIYSIGLKHDYSHFYHGTGLIKTEPAGERYPGDHADPKQAAGSDKQPPGVGPAEAEGYRPI